MVRLRSGLVVVSSKAMGENGEDNVARVPKATRDHHSIGGPVLVIGEADQAIELSVRSGLIMDMKRVLARRDMGGALANVLFVSPNTQARIKRLLDQGTPSSAAWIAENVDNLTVGSDPEFGLIDGNQNFIYAAHVVADQNKNKPVGSDGPCMELRPSPSKGVDTHVETIRTLIAEARSMKEIEKYQWWTGASYKTPDRTFVLGGHIHVGDPKAFSTALQGGRVFDPEATRRRVVRVLDELVATLLTRIDTPDARERRRQGYGKFGDWRTQPGRFEWRTPSALWLSNPDLAGAVLGTAKAVAEDCYKKIFDMKYSQKRVSGLATTKNSFLNTLGCWPEEKIRQLLNESTPDVLSEGDFDNVCQRLRALSTYPKYKSYIERLIAVTKFRTAVDVKAMDKAWLG